VRALKCVPLKFPKPGLFGDDEESRKLDLLDALDKREFASNLVAIFFPVCHVSSRQSSVVSRQSSVPGI
jgi:hypothetical protein